VARLEGSSGRRRAVREGTLILIFGHTGQVAREIARLVPDAVFLGRRELNLSEQGTARSAIHRHLPESVINASAYTAVDKAESEPGEASQLNERAPSEMAAACAELNIPFVHISTDYVFDGSGERPFQPTEPTGPLNTYGRTKLAGENAVRAEGGAYAILRTSWVFSLHGNNFVKTMLRLSETRDHLRIVADQIGGPTPAADIARACLTIAERLRKDPALTGTYHFSGAPDVSWADFAREIFRQTGRDVTVEDIPTSAYPTPAERPKNSRLNCDSLSVFGLERPDWREGLSKVLHELGALK
jgi:dTDP-4-dehydrorhamnose reductase